MSFIQAIKSKKVYLDELQKMKITQEDMQELSVCMQKVKELEEKYNESILDRQKIAFELKEELDSLRLFTWLLNNRINGIYSKYERLSDKEYPFVTDYELAMRLLLRLANSNEEKYIVKPFYSSDFLSQETKHGDRDFEITEGTTLIIGEKGVLDSIDNSKSYCGSELGKITYQLVKNGYSLIIGTNNYFDINVKPGSGLSTFHNINVTEFDIRCCGPDLSCYLFDDELKTATEKLMKFITENGADIKGLNEDKLFEVINKQSKTEGFIKKLKRY